MDTLRLYVHVPIASFRAAQAREYWETYPCPPPSTVYGMLLSLVGEPDRLVHQGAEIAIAILSRPPISTVLRTLWRIKSAKTPPGIGSNKRPDFAELLTDVRLSLWVRRGTDQSNPPLLDRLHCALENPASVSRFGGLSLGESQFLVNEARSWRHTDPLAGWALTADEKGNLALPIWPDHVGAKGTRWAQFSLRRADHLEPTPSMWTAILPP